ncbi:hypothetical protein ACX0G9_05025 [Flavitalea flava]
MNSLKTPVLFIVFNRTDTSSRVFSAIREARPERLYIAADGPRPGVPEDTDSCALTRKIAEAVDWDCQVHTLFREENLGTKYGIIAAVNWFFEQEEEGIILEHDCLPAKDFFGFCSSLLERYRNDPRIMHITGSNLQFGRKRGNASYYYSGIAAIWGWASWRRVWRQCDPDMKVFTQFAAEDRMIDVFPDRRTADWVTGMAQQVYEKKIITWDYPMAFSILVNNGLCITPNENLVSNIGFGDKAIHTRNAGHAHADIPLGEIKEIVHPLFFITDKKADIFQLSLSIDNIKKEDVHSGPTHSGSTHAGPAQTGRLSRFFRKNF